MYPLTLTLPIALWGIDFDAIRRTQLILWAIFLVAVYFLTRRRLTFVLSLLVVAAVGLSPYFFTFKEYIASEALFLALSFSTFILAARLEGHNPDGNLLARSGAWLGLMVALCIATRTVGLILLPTLVIWSSTTCYTFADCDGRPSSQSRSR